jgi:hypothetical protein
VRLAYVDHLAESATARIARLAHVILSASTLKLASETPSQKPPDTSTKASLIALWLRQNAGRQTPALDARVPWFALDHAISGDLGHLHAAHDLRALPVVSKGKLTGPVVRRFRSLLRRGLYPLPESQSVWNGANARVLSFLLHQLVIQARAIESLESQVSALQDEFHR